MNYNLSDVCAGVATMPSRVDSLKEMVDSIIPQVGKLVVYLNDFNETPWFLIGHPKIQVIHSADAIGDIGDVGKFYGLKNHNGYYFTLDDDLIYPGNYVKTYIDNINKYKCIVTAHGRIYVNFPITSYYISHSHLFHCLKSQVKNSYVQVGGTGVMAFHTDKFNPDISDFETSNMSDVWLAIFAAKAKVPIISVNHNARWIRESRKYNREFTIWASCHTKDSMQTAIINSFPLPAIKPYVI